MFKKILNFSDFLKKDEDYNKNLLLLEQNLLQSDLSYSITSSIISKLSKKKIQSSSLKDFVSQELLHLLKNYTKKIEISQTKPFVILMFGVNGSGKTTTIAKLASKYKTEGKKVLVIAADTFRAAAVAQLSEWSEKLGFDIEKPLKDSEDPSTTCYRGINRSINDSYDIVLVDTAGRLGTNPDLMNQLSKISRTINKLCDSAPNLSLMVMDSSIGQNSIKQVEAFSKHLNIDGVIITKLDSSSKGGAIFSIAGGGLKKNIYLACFGETSNDITDFNAETFVENIL